MFPGTDDMSLPVVLPSIIPPWLLLVVCRGCSRVLSRNIWTEPEGLMGGDGYLYAFT